MSLNPIQNIKDFTTQQYNSALAYIGNLELPERINVYKQAACESTRFYCQKDYTPEQRVVLFSIPFFGSLFYVANELECKWSLEENPSSANERRITQIKKDLIQSHMGAVAIMIMFNIFLGVVSPSALVINFVVMGVQYFRYTQLQEQLSRMQPNCKTAAFGV